MTEEATKWHELLQKIIPVPRSICDTQFIKIIAVNAKGIHSQNSMRWEMKARCHDPLLPRKINTVFDITKEEVEKWLNVKTSE